MKSKIAIYILFLLLIIMSSCEKYFDVEPVGQVSEENYYKNINDLQTGLYAAYAILKENTFQRTLALLGDGISDDFLYQFRLNPGSLGVDAYKMEQFNITADNVWVLNWYQENYKGIYRVNQVLRHMEDNIPITYTSADNSSIVMWRHIYGQLYFLRGYYYFNLVKAFGGIPIQPEKPIVGNTTFPRASKDSVYAYIEKDLRTATLLLHENPGNGANNTGVNNTMHYNEPCKFTALALLTKVLIYQAKPGIPSDKWLEAKKIGDCLFSGQTLTFDDVLKLSVNFKESTWHQLVLRFKFDKIMQSTVNDSSGFIVYKKPNGTGILADVNLSNIKGFYNWLHIWRVQYQNSSENHNVLFCAPAFTSPVFYQNTYPVTTFVDALYGVQHNDSNPLAPTTSLNKEMHLEPGDPRNWYGIVTHDMGPIGKDVPDLPTSMRFGGIGEENYLLILKRFLFAGSELGSDDNASPRNLLLMRYNEYILFYAEALNECGDLVKPIDIINNMRKQLVASLKQVNSDFSVKLDYGPSSDYVRGVIWHERRVELCAEFDRFWDIVRQGRAAEIMNGPVEDQAGSKIGLKFIKGKNELLPIPEVEIELSNNVITQNPGY